MVISSIAVPTQEILTETHSEVGQGWPNGYTSSYEHDLLGRITKKINPDSSEIEAIYDDLINCLTLFDELDHSIRKYYDGLRI